MPGFLGVLFQGDMAVVWERGKGPWQAANQIAASEAPPTVLKHRFPQRHHPPMRLPGSSSFSPE